MRMPVCHLDPNFWQRGVSDIGLKSEWIEVGRGTLFIGMKLAHFHKDGTWP